MYYQTIDMNYVEPSERFYKMYLKTFGKEMIPILDYIYNKFDNVFLENYNLPQEEFESQYDFTMLKGGNHRIINTIVGKKNSWTLDIRSICSDLVKDIHCSKDDKGVDEIYSKCLKFIESYANFDTIILVDLIMAPHTISSWKMEDYVIQKIQKNTNYLLVQISKETKEKSFWKYLKTDIGVIIGDFIYPLNSLLYYREFIGKEKPATRIKVEDAEYTEIQSENQHVELEYDKRFTISGNSELHLILR